MATMAPIFAGSPCPGCGSRLTSPKAGTAPSGVAESRLEFQHHGQRRRRLQFHALGQLQNDRVRFAHAGVDGPAGRVSLSGEVGYREPLLAEVGRRRSDRQPLLRLVAVRRE